MGIFNYKKMIFLSIYYIERRSVGYMYKKKELIYLAIIVIVLLLIGYFLNEDNKIEEQIDTRNTIVVKINGEIARDTCLEFQNPITYGSLFLKIKSLLNDYSDLSGFDLYKTINSNTNIHIPTLDKNNHYDSKAFIYINTATKQELMSLPQIGEKRSEKIIEYIKTNGKIKTWDEFFKIVSVKDEYKEAIKKQAVL